MGSSTDRVATRSTLNDQPPAPTIDSVMRAPRWRAVAPIRAYVRYSPFQRGKGLLIRRLLLPALPAHPRGFVAPLPGGGLVQLLPRETIGFSTLVFGGFEAAEIKCAIEQAAKGTTTFDVGANVGIFSVALAGAVGSDGQVVAIEPDPACVRRLRANLTLNSVINVRVVEAAANDRDAMVELHLADDPAYNSVVAIEGPHSETETAWVPSVRLDQIWSDLGRPSVSFVKVDVEGAEAAVIRGAAVMIRTARPALLMEAADRQRLALVRSELEPLGYDEAPQPGFQPWNHLFVHRHQL